MGADTRLCTFCGSPRTCGLRTMDGKEICHACLEARKAVAPENEPEVRRYLTRVVIGGVEQTVIDAGVTPDAKVPMNIIAKSRSIDRGEGSIADLVGQIEHDAWEAGFEAAVRIVEHEGGTAVAEVLRDALADYWETQGVERED